MQVKVQVVTMTDDGQEIIQEVACIERQDLTPVTLGLSLAEGKAVLQALQEVVVEWQMEAYLGQPRTCPQCGVQSPGDPTARTDHPGTALPGNHMGGIRFRWPDQH